MSKGLLYHRRSFGVASHTFSVLDTAHVNSLPVTTDEEHRVRTGANHRMERTGQTDETGPGRSGHVLQRGLASRSSPPGFCRETLLLLTRRNCAPRISGLWHQLSSADAAPIKIKTAPKLQWDHITRPHLETRIEWVDTHANSWALALTFECRRSSNERRYIREFTKATIKRYIPISSRHTNGVG